MTVSCGDRQKIWGDTTGVSFDSKSTCKGPPSMLMLRGSVKWSHGTVCQHMNPFLSPHHARSQLSLKDGSISEGNNCKGDNICATFCGNNTSTFLSPPFLPSFSFYSCPHHSLCLFLLPPIALSIMHPSPTPLLLLLPLSRVGCMAYRHSNRQP